MIQNAFNLIYQELNSYIEDLYLSDSDSGPLVVGGNIAACKGLGGQENYMNNKIVMGLVNTMEEATLRNVSPLRSIGDQIELERPPVFLNVYFLFTANFPYEGNMDSGTDMSPGGHQVYVNSMERLSRVVEFFQGKSQFNLHNAPIQGLMNDNEGFNLCIDMELVTLTFEQINYLWGSLGGKQLPFVLYKAYVIPVKRQVLSGREGIIEDIQAESYHINPSN